MPPVATKPAPQQSPQPATKPQSAPQPSPQKNYNFDPVIIGGGPAGYAAAIRAGQLKKRVLCIEKENLGGTCLNWGCIPTKALLEDGAFIRKLRTSAGEHGVTVGDVKIDFAKIIGRSRQIAGKLSGGSGHLFLKYEEKNENGTRQLIGPHRDKKTGKQRRKER